jgi:hypothetical protein
MNRNEARKLEDMNPGPDELNEFTLMLNVGPVTGEGAEGSDKDEATTGNKENGDDDSDDENGNGLAAVRAAIVPVLSDIADRLIRKEVNAADRARKRTKGDPAAFKKWAKEFYLAHEKSARASYGPAADMMSSLLHTKADPEDIARRHISTSRGQLLGIPAEDPTKYWIAVSARLKSWSADRAAHAAREEVSRYG